MIQQLGLPITFEAFYVLNKLGKPGLNVTLDIYPPNGATPITSLSASATGGGLYYYTFANPNVVGSWRAIFHSISDNTVDQIDIPSLWEVGVAGVSNLDASVNSRLATTAYTVADNTDIVAIRANTDKLSFNTSSQVFSAAQNLPVDYQQRGVAVTLPSTIPDTAGVSTLLTRVPGTVQPQTGDSFARIGANGSALNKINLDLTQPLNTSNAGDTVGGGLIAARAQAFGKWIINGTPGTPSSYLYLYAADNVTLLRTFDLSASGTRA